MRRTSRKHLQNASNTSLNAGWHKENHAYPADHAMERYHGQSSRTLSSVCLHARTLQMTADERCNQRAYDLRHAEHTNASTLPTRELTRQTTAAGSAQTFCLSLTRTVRDKKLGRQTAGRKHAGSLCREAHEARRSVIAAQRPVWHPGTRYNVTTGTGAPGGPTTCDQAGGGGIPPAF